MRKIKFRYWNGITNKMVNTPQMPHKEGWSIEQLFEERGWVWMQFTGLLDREGREIYEGDILHIKSTEPGAFGGVGKVEFDAGEYALVQSNGSYMWLSGEADTSLGYTAKNEREVIGNVYENPELLKK